MNLFNVMRDQMAFADARLFRVYLDGNLSAEADDWIRHTEPHRSERLESWLQRSMGYRHFCIIVNHAEKWSDTLACFTAEFVEPIRESLGKNHTNVEISFFIGNYGHTPFGIHLDDPYSSVVHLHLGATKTMYLWNDEVFKQSDGIHHRFDVDNLKMFAESYKIESGDVFVLPPHYWHIGEATDFSVGLAIAISRETDVSLTRNSLGYATTNRENFIEFKQNITSEEAERTSIATWFANIDRHYQISLESNRGLKSPYTSNCHFLALTDSKQISLEKMFPPMMMEIGGKQWVYSRGNRKGINEKCTFERLIGTITNGAIEMQAISRMLKHEDDDVAHAEGIELLAWLIKTRSVRVMDDQVTKCSSSSTSICSLPTLKNAVAQVMDKKDADFFDLTPLMNDLCRENIIELLNDVLERREITSSYELLSEDHIYLHRQKNFHLLMRFIGKSTRNTLYANEFDVFVLNPTTDVIAVPFYECQTNPDNMHQQKKLRRLDDIKLEPNKPYCFEAYKYILDFECDTQKDAFVLIAHSEPKGWLTWIYDRESLAPIESISTDLQASRIQLYVRLLGAMKSEQSVPTLEKLATSNYANFVRWEAVESLSRINPSRCLTVLRQLAANDADHVIQKIAGQSMCLSGATPN
ncbi:hypothetical protein BPUN_4423 [Candidatus Paraburkholderia kirkii]|nr:hypothetical protein BPUN_4423 [Candidatus Paraburkholderia kirkii]